MKYSSILFKTYQKQNKIIPIVLASDDNFAPYAGVVIQSIIENASPDRFYDIYVLHTHLSKNLQSILEQVGCQNLKVTCLDISDKINMNLYAQERYSKEMFFRFFIPELFPKYSKVLYLDCDLVVQTDVSELFDTNIDGFAVAGAVNFSTETFADYCEDKLKISSDKYINSGVLLINNKYWLKHYLCNKVWDIIGQEGSYITPDQDIINLVCFGKIKYVEQEWNAINPQNNLYLTAAFKLLKQNEIAKNAKILHFASENKPWKNPIYLNAEIWWQYAEKSPFYEYILTHRMSSN